MFPISKSIVLAAGIVLSAGLFFSCESAGTKQKTLLIGHYQFDVPESFTLIPEQGVDSDVGKITGEGITLYYDLGFYSSELVSTREEFLEKGYWRRNLSNPFLNPGITYNEENLPKVEVVSIRAAAANEKVSGVSCDYVAVCRYKDSVYNAPVVLPEDIRTHSVRTRMTSRDFFKTVTSENPGKGITGIYIRDTDSWNRSLNAFTALSLSAKNLTKEQQATVLKILKTARRKD